MSSRNNQNKHPPQLPPINSSNLRQNLNRYALPLTESRKIWMIQDLARAQMSDHLSKFLFQFSPAMIVKLQLAMNIVIPKTDTPHRLNIVPLWLVIAEKIAEANEESEEYQSLLRAILQLLNSSESLSWLYTPSTMFAGDIKQAILEQLTQFVNFLIQKKIIEQSYKAQLMTLSENDLVDQHQILQELERKKEEFIAQQIKGVQPKIGEREAQLQNGSLYIPSNIRQGQTLMIQAKKPVQGQQPEVICIDDDEEFKDQNDRQQVSTALQQPQVNPRQIPNQKAQISKNPPKRAYSQARKGPTIQAQFQRVTQTQPQAVPLKQCYKCSSQIKHFLEFPNPITPSPLLLQECLSCYMAAVDPTTIPLSRIDELHYIQLPCVPNATNQIILNFGYDVATLDMHDQIELRCIKMGSQFQFEIEFPPVYALTINDKATFAGQKDPLASKRRKDQAYSILPFLNTTKPQQEIKIAVQSYEKEPLSYYVFGIYKVKKIQEFNLRNYLEAYGVNLPINQCILQLQRYFESSFIEQETFKYKCQYSLKPIKMAGRGKLCQHFDCFDLENYFQMNQQSMLFLCPICKKKAIEVIRDLFYEQIIAAISESESHSQILITNDLKVTTSHRVIQWNGHTFRTVQGQQGDKIRQAEEVKQPQSEDIIDDEKSDGYDSDSSIEILQVVQPQRQNILQQQQQVAPSMVIKKEVSINQPLIPQKRTTSQMEEVNEERIEPKKRVCLEPQANPKQEALSSIFSDRSTRDEDLLCNEPLVLEQRNLPIQNELTDHTSSESESSSHSLCQPDKDPLFQSSDNNNLATATDVTRDDQPSSSLPLSYAMSREEEFDLNLSILERLIKKEKYNQIIEKHIHELLA